MPSTPNSLLSDPSRVPSGSLPAFSSPFPIPNSPFPIPNSPFPIPNSPFPIPNSPFPIPNSPLPISASPLPIPNSALPSSHSSLPAPSSPTPHSRFPTPNSPLATGRPRTLDATKRSEICALITHGCTFKDAARYVGSSVSTIHREARRDPEFDKRLRHAQREAELTPLSAVRHAAKRSWRAGAWLMERADAERFATKNARRVTITQLKKYNASLVRILKIEVHNRMLARHLTRLFNEALDHCVYKIAAGHDPFPIPPEITRADNWLPTLPRHRADPAPASTQITRP